MEFDRDKEHTLLEYEGDLDEFVDSEREMDLYGIGGFLLDLGVDEDYLREEFDGLENDLLISKAVFAHNYALKQQAEIHSWRVRTAGVLLPETLIKHVDEYVETTAARLSARRSLLERLRELLRQTMSRREIDSDIVEVPIILASIHVPEVKGASGAYIDKRKSSTEASFQVSIFGTGGGGKAKYSVETGRKHTASNGRCYNVESIAQVRVSKVERTLLGKTSIIPKSKCIGLRNGYRKSPISRADDQCGWTKKAIDEAGLSDKSYTYVLKRVQDPDTVSFSLVVAGEAYVKYGVDFGALGLEIEAQIGVASVSEKTVDYTLPPGYDYIAYPLANKFGYAWSWR